VLQKITEIHGTTSGDKNNSLVGLLDFEKKIQYDAQFNENDVNISDEDEPQSNDHAHSTKSKKLNLTHTTSASNHPPPPPPGSVLYGYQIQRLFLKKPEIAELIFLEICNYNNQISDK
jgi:hypothetical protein